MNCNVDFYDHFIDLDQSLKLYNYLEQNVEWSSKFSPKKRSNQTYGQPGLVYQVKFKNKTVYRKAIAWEQLPILGDIRDAISSVTGEQYNICVIQRYPNGKVGINPHRDKEMIPGTTICGLSLGATRKLVLQNKGYEPIQIELGTGSLYILKPPTNDYWTHSIIKDDTEGVRISLTFRNYKFI